VGLGRFIRPSLETFFGARSSLEGLTDRFDPLDRDNVRIEWEA
jgi:hypothetical protein